MAASSVKFASWDICHSLQKAVKSEHPDHWNTVLASFQEQASRSGYT